MVPGAAAFLCFCIVAVYSIGIPGEKYPEGYEKMQIALMDAEDSRKFKRDMVSGLVSFPRIGRGESVWKIGPPETKRQSLVSFPRTGKRNPSDTTTQDLPDVLWLGPERKASINFWTPIHTRDFPLLFSKAGKDNYAKWLEASEGTG